MRIYQTTPMYSARRLLLLLFIVTTTSGLFAQSDAKAPESVITVTGDTFDFGYIPFGTSIKHTLYIQNDADTSLRITKVNPGCGCTTIPLKEREVGPGGTLEVDLIIDTGKIHPGDFKKASRIYTDSRKRPQIVCNLTGHNFQPEGEENQRLLEIDPLSLVLPKNRASDSSMIVLTNKSQLTLIPRVIELPDPDIISVNVPAQAIIPGQRLQIDLKVNDISGVKADAILESLTLAFNDPARTRITVPIRVMK